jgi:hypothetical protein
MLEISLTVWAGLVFCHPYLNASSAKEILTILA